MFQKIELRKTTDGKIDLLKKVIKIIGLIEDYKMSNGEVDVLCYIILYGDNLRTFDLCIKLNLLKNKSVYSNMKSKFKKLGFLVKDERRQYLPADFLDPSSDKVGMIIKLDNTNG